MRFVMLSFYVITLLLINIIPLYYGFNNQLSNRLLIKTSTNKNINQLNKITQNTKLFSKSTSNPNNYWEGEWICADCGYVYDRDIDGGGLYFEELKKGFICPQCSAPRKRYAKKVGDTWGVTRDGGDFPIYAVTFLGLAFTTWFALVYVPTL
mmetsp:Transcript_12915/g.11704  ORF Transcript_12915/g.11704 Transcript_12915/m.11704 type:complete len:152 (-) Transcript_12915:80-535(-)